MAREMNGRADPRRAPQGDEATDTAIELADVRHYFGDLLVLDGVDLSIPAESRVSFVGPSGCGKSTLLLMIAGLLRQQGGDHQGGQAAEPPSRLRQCALMPQQDLLMPWRTALDNACLALENRGMSRSAARKRPSRSSSASGSPPSSTVTRHSCLAACGSGSASCAR